MHISVEAASDPTRTSHCLQRLELFMVTLVHKTPAFHCCTVCTVKVLINCRQGPCLKKLLNKGIHLRQRNAW